MNTWVTSGMKTGELVITASGTDCGLSIFNHQTNSTDYYYIVPTHGRHWMTWHDKCLELDEWCIANIGVKYAAWDRSLNKFTFYKKKDYVQFMLTCGYEES